MVFQDKIEFYKHYEFLRNEHIKTKGSKPTLFTLQQHLNDNKHFYKLGIEHYDTCKWGNCIVLEYNNKLCAVDIVRGQIYCYENQNNIRLIEK